MMSIILIFSITLIITVAASICLIYGTLFTIAEKNANIKLKQEKAAEQEKKEKQEIFFKNQCSSIEFEKQRFSVFQTEQFKRLREKENIINNHHQQANQKLLEAKQISENSEEKIRLLQKQITKLQSTLHNARQKSRRLAKNPGNGL